jgi:phosphatidylserine/phosphatidylglycerophosphate/cardiolipin synthase-like enzyme
MDKGSPAAFQREICELEGSRIRRRPRWRCAPGSARQVAGFSRRLGSRLVLASVLVTGTAAATQAREQLCDPQSSDCRTPLLNLIRNETRRIDVAFWYMTDARYATEIVRRSQAGVPVRVLIDDRANRSKPRNAYILDQLKSAGIPMRNKTGGGNLHWKVMIFDGQDVVEFSKANYSAESFAPIQANANWTDEAIYFTSDDQTTNTFRTKFDDMWTNTSTFVDYANVAGTPARAYPVYPVAWWMNMPPGEDFAKRSVDRYNQETQAIDALVFRVTDARHADAMIAAVKRGVRVRLIMEPQQYREPTKKEDSYNIDRMYMAGVQIKKRNHLGLLHEAAVICHGVGAVIFGSSNWSVPSANSQSEHNFFYKPSVNIVLDSGETFFDWFKNQFNRKWNNTNSPNAFVPFVPLPPTQAVYQAPANDATNMGSTVTLRWEGGDWAWKYDVLLGTTPTLTSNNRVARDLALSPLPNRAETFTLQNLRPGTTYYWRVVSKTMANKLNYAPVQRFTTAANVAANDLVIHAGKAPIKTGSWQAVSDSTAASGVRMHQADRGAGKVTTPAAAPANYFEVSINALAQISYHLWLRGKADANSYTNDSVWVQFTNSLDAAGRAVWRIGSATATAVSIERCNGCGVQGWGWSDNGYGTLGPAVRFSTSGVQRIRIQQREDGVSIDQIVLSPSRYLATPPGAAKNDSTILREAGVASLGTALGLAEPTLLARLSNLVPRVWRDRGTAPAGSALAGNRTGGTSGPGEDGPSAALVRSGRQIPESNLGAGMTTAGDAAGAM